MTTRLSILAAATVERRMEFARLPHDWAAMASLAALAAILYGVVWFYRREARTGASPRSRAAMASLRCLLVLALALLWLQPVWATYIHRTIESYTLVLLDGSASMKLADRYADAAEAARVAKFLADAQLPLPPREGGKEDVKVEPPFPARERDGVRVTTSQPSPTTTLVAHDPIRRDILQTHLLTRHDARWLKALAARNRVELWSYGDEPRRLGSYGPQPPASTPPRSMDTAAADEFGDPVTDLGRAVRQAVEGLGSAPVAAIVVIGDGGLNRGEPPDTIARYARSRNIPIFAVGIGDPSPIRNVRVAEIIAPANAFVKDPFTITAQLVAEGLADGQVHVQLVESSGGEGERVVAAEQAPIGPDGRIAPVVFRRQVDEARSLTYAVRVQPIPNEAVTDDNSRQTTVRVLENKMRILLVSGSPAWDYQFVERLLERDKAVDVSCWLQSADVDAVRDGTTVISEFPRKPEQLFQYDVVVLFDPQPRDFDPAWCELAQTLVGSNGGGLLLTAGRKYTSRFMTDPNCRGLIETLPVLGDPDAELILNQLGHFQTQAWPVAVPPEVAGHPVLAQAETPAETLAVWRQLTGVYWHYPVRREKPLATVLLRHSNPRMANAYGPHVLLATQFFGAGRTGFLAFDSTWRWRRFGEQYFNRFWIQLLRHLMEGRILGGSRRGVLMTDRESFAVGEPITLTARLLNESHLPLDAAEIGVAVAGEDGGETHMTLHPEPGRPGWYRGRYIPNRIGRILFKAALPGGDRTPADVVTHAVQIVRPNLETLRPRMDREKMMSLAEQSAGGRYVPIDEADTIPGQIEDRNASLVVTGTPILLQDRFRWPLFVILLALLTAEWILRKRSRLL